jgi:hypothetical protein
LPETDENVRLAGGRRNIFTLADANWKITHGSLTRKKLPLKAISREIEIFPIVTLHSKFLSAMTAILFHPKKAYASMRISTAKFLKRKE